MKAAMTIAKSRVPAAPDVAGRAEEPPTAPR